jgi:hypothetical protein
MATSSRHAGIQHHIPMPSFGLWEYVHDRKATAAAYALADKGGSQHCQCSGCRNFIAVRLQVFPPPFLHLLETLGIDYAKDAEVFRNARIAPGRHRYGGWYHFAGSLQSGDFSEVEMVTGFKVWMNHGETLCLKSLKGYPLVQVGFSCDRVPWRLKEAEPQD